MEKWIQGIGNAIGAPLTTDDLDRILTDLWPDVLTQPLTVIMSLHTRHRIEEAMQVWKDRQRTVELLLSIYQKNAGNRRRQGRVKR